MNIQEDDNFVHHEEILQVLRSILKRPALYGQNSESVEDQVALLCNFLFGPRVFEKEVDSFLKRVCVRMRYEGSISLYVKEILEINDPYTALKKTAEILEMALWEHLEKKEAELKTADEETK